MASNNDLDFDEKNASTLAEMLVDPATTEAVRLQIINDILEAAGDNTFFETMMKEDMSKSACPMCKHKTHWLVPEEDLNQMGWVSSEKDSRVPQHSSSAICPEFAEACLKKRTTA